MKIKLLYSFVLICCSLLFSLKGYSQINYSQNFESGTSEWSEGGFNYIQPDYACTGLSMTMYGYTLNGDSQPVSMESGSLGTSNGQQATLSYLYKVSDYYTGQGMPNNPNWGSIVVEYATSPGGPWIIIDTVTPANHTVSSSCVVRTVNFTPPSGSSVYLKITTATSAGDPNVELAFELYSAFDNISVTQAVPCSTPAPTAIVTPQVFCNNNTVGGLNTVGFSAINWYTAAAGGSALALATPLSSGIYYAAQVLNGCESTQRTPVTVTIGCTKNLKLFIEGYYAGAGTMAPVKANQGVGSSSTDVDDVTVELRNASTFALGATTTAVLKTNGTVAAKFNAFPAGNYFIVVKHRNSIETWSAAAVAFDVATAAYDFTTAANKAYGSNMVNLGGVFGFYSGDLNQDGFIEGEDYAPLFNASDALLEGFQTTDLNGDGFVEGQDYPFLFNNSDALIEVLRP
ncbi:MAG: hypothetical protein M0D53_01255 [Flavobacterium sp. JAD_PAG50586_2]|nr:MAG: hypothetical protein M0D53_01255 [Flavobacterium sp. JAD_PAG50586_2]